MPQEPQRRAERSPDVEKFQQEMHKRVEKVSETDEEQKKKRKRKDEAEEEEGAKELPNEPTRAPTTPFSLEASTRKPSPLDMQAGGTISPMESAQPTLGAENTPAPFFAPPPPTAEEIQDDAGMETSYIEMPEDEIIPDTYTYQPPAFPGGQVTPPKTAQEQSSMEDKPPEAPAKPKTEKQGPTKGKTEKPEEWAKRAEGAVPPKKKKGVTSEELEKMVEGAPEETSAYFAAATKKESVLPQEEEAAIEGVVVVPPLPPSDYIEKEKKKAEVGAVAAPAPQAPVLPEAPPILLAPQPATPYTSLHPQVMELFDRMVGTMSVMNLSGVTETVIDLSAEKFASSVFFGSQIIIREYSSAPLAYNIQINGSAQAVALLEKNAATLMAAFQHGNYTFRVHRLESGLLEERPKVKRKEPPGKGKEK